MTDYAHRILECVERLELGEETPEDREQIAAFVREMDRKSVLVKWDTDRLILDLQGSRHEQIKAAEHFKQAGNEPGALLYYAAANAFLEAEKKVKAYQLSTESEIK